MEELKRLCGDLAISLSREAHARALCETALATTVLTMEEKAQASEKLITQLTDSVSREIRARVACEEALAAARLALQERERVDGVMAGRYKDLHRHVDAMAHELRSHRLKSVRAAQWEEAAASLADQRLELEREMLALRGTCAHAQSMRNDALRELGDLRSGVESSAVQIRMLHAEVERHRRALFERTPSVSPQRRSVSVGVHVDMRLSMASMGTTTVGVLTLNTVVQTEDELSVIMGLKSSRRSASPRL